MVGDMIRHERLDKIITVVIPVMLPECEFLSGILAGDFEQVWF